MNRITENSAFDHISEQIFGYVDSKTLSQCILVSKNWYNLLIRTFLIRQLKFYVHEKFWVRDSPRKLNLVELCPDWTKVAQSLQKFGNNEDIKIIVKVLRIYVLNYKDKNSRCTPLQLAVENNFIEFLKICLYSNTDFNTKDAFGYTPFLTACRLGKMEVVKLLFDHSKSKNIDVNAHDNLGTTGLHLACEGNLDLIQYFCDNCDTRIDFNTRDNCGQTPFHDACGRGRLQIVKFLLENSKRLKIDVNATDGRGRTGLHLACEEGHTQIVKLLLDMADELQINVLALDGKGNTILQSACLQSSIFDRKKNPEIAKLILERSIDIGLDIHHRNHSGKSAIGIAQRMGFQLALDILGTFSQ